MNAQTATCQNHNHDVLRKNRENVSYAADIISSFSSSIIAVMIALVVVGCASPDYSKLVTVKSIALSFDNHDSALLLATNNHQTMISPENPANIFLPIIDHEINPKNPLTIENNKRKLTFLIPPKYCLACEVPEGNCFVVVAREWYSPEASRYDAQRWAVTVTERMGFQGEDTSQQPFGRIPIAHYTGYRWMLRLEGVNSFSPVTKWRETGSFAIHFGLPATKNHPGFATLLKEKKVALAVRGVLGDVNASTITRETDSAVRGKSISTEVNVVIVPFIVEEVYLVDAWTNSVIVTYKR